ncbi:MAG: TIGR04282 family arsenosugar biosynthesis glycosyltransferase [Pseudomonadota bacterium]
MTKQLVVMLKEPRPGRVKTRLGRDIGMTQAAWWFRHQTTALLRRLVDPRWQIILAVAPDHEGLKSRVWPGAFARIPQGNGNLGTRMLRLLSSLPPGPICIIGSDIPDIQKHHIMQAFVALNAHDAVFGPAPDGGYWLVGMKRISGISAKLFEGVRWSTPHALADSRASLGNARVALVETLGDIDTLDDLRRWQAGNRGAR